MTAAIAIQEGNVKKLLRIAEDLALPLDAVTQTLAAIGRKGAGKTYLATVIAEQMLDAGAQVVAVDPVGNWFGLRVGADGKSKGKEIFVLGGEHGDVPLTPEVGAKIARLLVEKRISAVLDVSSFRQGERKRFAADFAEELFHLKKTQRTPLHVFLEEAQLFAPQRPGPDDARMLGAFEHIVRLGRNYGIGCTLVTQRPQSVNKEVLSQVECLCVLQVTGPHERKALEEWVQEVGGERKLVGELPGLARGEGYVWSPSWLRTYLRVRFARKTTFDASATPEVGKAARAASLSAVDVDALRVDLAEVVAAAEKDDPKALRRRVADLERELAKKPATAPPAPAAKSDPNLVTLVRQLRKAVDQTMKFLVTINAQDFFKAGGPAVDSKEIEKAIGAAVANVTKLLEAKVEHRNREIERLQKEAGRVLGALKSLASDDVAVQVTVRHNEPFTVAATPARPARAAPPRPAAVGEEGELPPVALRMLENVARFHPHAVTRRQLATLSGYSAKSSSFRNVFSILNARALVAKRGDEVTLSPAGEAVFGGNLPPPMTPEEVQALWRERLPPVAWKMLEVVLQQGRVSRAALAEACGYSPTSSSFRNVFSVLNANELVDKEGDDVLPAAALVDAR